MHDEIADLALQIVVRQQWRVVIGTVGWLWLKDFVKLCRFVLLEEDGEPRRHLFSPLEKSCGGKTRDQRTLVEQMKVRILENLT